MFKGKIKVWCIAFCVAFVVNGLVHGIPKWVKSWDDPDINISVDFFDDVNASELLTDTSLNGLDIYSGAAKPDIVFTDLEKNFEGYEHYEDFLYTPLVLYMRASIFDNRTGVSKVNSQKSSSPYRIDLLKILEGIEKDMDWRSLEISNKVAKGKVSLCIPSIESGYYESVRTLFLNTLRGSNVLTPSEEAVLEERVDRIIEKCEKVKDIDGAIVNEVHNPSTNYKVFIGPEYLYIRGNRNDYTSQYNNTYVPIYFYNTVLIYKDAWVKKGETSANIEDGIATSYDNSNMFITKAQEGNSFTKVLGYRVRDSIYNINDISNILLKSL